MEVRSANIALTNRAAAAIDNSGSNGKEQQHAMKVNSAVPEENQELDDESVMLSISAAGLKRSLQLEKQTEKEAAEETFTGETELEDMMKKMEGLSSQVINGHFSISDRLSFNSEIEKLTNEINRLNGDNMVVTKNNCMQLSQRISDLTRNISAAAVYRNSARTVFMVNSRQPVKPTDSMLDITL
ncbi:MAG: hypothetical protein K1W16_00730 [Lachnospiraceae bacterium]|jgi:Protein involved in chromosome segregation, interacts with SMC proteins